MLPGLAPCRAVLTFRVPLMGPGTRWPVPLLLPFLPLVSF